MAIQIIGGDQGSEREAAETLRQILDPIVGPTNQLLIIVGAQCLGEEVQDIDLLLLGSFGTGITFQGTHAEACGQNVKLVNICLIVEVKDSLAHKIRFDSQHVKVSYGRDNFWKDATEQVRQQKLSLINYLKRCNLPSPWVEGMIWLRNYNGIIPQSAANVLGANATVSSFFEVLEKIRPPRPSTQGFYIAFAKNENVNSIQRAAAFFHPTITPTRLDRRRLELICKRLISDQRYVDRLGMQLLVFRGRGGSGKTIHLLRFAKDLYDRGKRVLLLTFNKALVADIRRLLVILRIDNQGFDRGISISTAHKFFMQMLSAWGLWTWGARDDGQFPKVDYTRRKTELLQLLANETPESLSSESVVNNAPEVFAWDYVLVDEGQDWPEDERDLLYRCFGPDRCIVADGVDQLIRGLTPCDWTAPVVPQRRQTVALRKAMRMKANLCRFITAFAEEGGAEWDQEINEEISGGVVSVIEGPYDIACHNEIFRQHHDQGNEPLDALFCVPPDSMVQTPVFSERLKAWGLSVWDGTSPDVRETFPTTTQEHRVVRYESCRGLEGWTVICIGLDRFYQHRLSHTTSPQTQELFETPADFIRRQAVAWCLIPLTRAIDHLVIQLDGPGVVTNICRKLSRMHPEFVTWRKTN